MVTDPRRRRWWVHGPRLAVLDIIVASDWRTWLSQEISTSAPGHAQCARLIAVSLDRILLAVKFVLFRQKV